MQLAWCVRVQTETGEDRDPGYCCVCPIRPVVLCLLAKQTSRSRFVWLSPCTAGISGMFTCKALRQRAFSALGMYCAGLAKTVLKSRYEGIY